MNFEELKLSIRVLLRSKDAENFWRLVHTTSHADIADALAEHPADQIVPLLMILPAPDQAELFSHFSAASQDALLQSLPHKAVVTLFENMPSDDRADLFNRLDETAQTTLLPALAKVERDDILKLSAYPEGSVGSVMTSDYATVNYDLTVGGALETLRRSAPDKETIYVIYVLDDNRRLQNTLGLRDLVLAPPHIKLAELEHRNPICVRASWPAKQATQLIRRHDLLAVPVVDDEQRMIGIVTVDDAMDIEKQQDAAQLARFGGTIGLGGENDLDLRESSFSKMFKVRLLWLVVLVFFGTITSTFVAAQEALLTKAIVLAAFIAPIVDMGGNTGSQSATLVIRAMALGELRLRWQDVWFVIKRELPVAGALGIVITIMESILAYFSKGLNINVLFVVGASMLVCTVLGSVIGAVLPFLARKVGTDPATLSSPLITSIMDLLGVFIYFGFAYYFLGDLLV